MSDKVSSEKVEVLISSNESKRLEDALRESEEKYKSIVEMAPDGIMTVDMKGMVTSINPAFSRLTGFSEDEIVGKHFTKLGTIRAGDIPKYLKLFSSILRGKAIPPFESTYRRKNGTIAWVEAHPCSMKVNDKTVGFQVILRDITERKKAEQTVRENQQKFERLFMSNPEASVYWDADFRVLGINSRFTELFGYSLGEVRGKKPDDLIVPKDKIEESYALGRRAKKGYVNYDTVRKRKDGSLVPVSISTAPLIVGGRLIGYVGLYLDITKRKKAEEALKASKENYKTLAESITDVFFAMDKDLKYTYWNKASEDLTGISARDAIGKSLTEVFPDVKDTKVEQFYIDVLRTKRSKSFLNEYRIGDKDFVFEINAYPVEDGLSVFVKDITERKMAEKALRNSESKSRTLLENLPQKIFFKDKNSVYISCNENYALDLKIHSNKISGKTDYDFYPKELAEKYRADDKRIMESEKIEDIEEDYVHDGKRVFVHTVKTPVKDENGNVVGILGIFWDITERKQMEEKLRHYSEHLEELVQKRTDELLESEKRYSVLVEEASDGVVIIQDGKIAFINKKGAEISGHSIQELIGSTYDRLLGGGCRQIVEERSLQALRGEKVPAIIEVEVIAKTGERVPVEGSGKLINHLGHPALLVVLRDVKERKRLEEQRLKLERLATVGELATMVAHDLRNPLTSIRNAGFYIKNTCPAHASRECKNAIEMLNIIDQEIIFANNIINDLLDFAAKRPLQKSRKNINKIIDDSLTKNSIPENIKIERNFDKKAIATVDEKQLERVFLNLTKNAVQAMLSGGKLTITTNGTEDHIEIIFTDTGVGISEENMNKVFQPLFTTKAKGIGMGLAICKRIVEEHDGTIDVESKIGQGTTFIIKLPKNEETNNQ